MFSFIQELGRGILVLRINQIIDYHRIDTNSSSAAFNFGGRSEYVGLNRTSQGIFHYMQDDNLYCVGTGSRTNYELVNFRIIMDTQVPTNISHRRSAAGIRLVSVAVTLVFSLPLTEPTVQTTSVKERITTIS